MDDIDQLLSETEQDANEISAIAIRLVNKFSNNQTLLGFIAEANRVREGTHHHSHPLWGGFRSDGRNGKGMTRETIAA